MTAPRPLILSQVAQEGFLRAVFSKPRGPSRWTHVVVKPVAIRGERRIQVVCYDAKRSITKNYATSDVGPALDAVFEEPFEHVHLESSTASYHVRFDAKGRSKITRGRPSCPGAAPDLSHNRAKHRYLDADNAADLLTALGMLDGQGRIRASKERKYRQINEFIKLVEQTGQLDTLQSPVRVIDFSCGNAYLSFALRHYLAMRGHTVALTGVDVDRDALERNRAKARQLGLDDVVFVESSNRAFVAEGPPPDIVVALHACDTATDEALAQAVLWRSRLVFLAPCCHHDLQVQLAKGRRDEAFAPIFRHPILREHMGTIITDALRAHALRIRGYRTQVVQFVSPEHSAKNLMIIAVFTGTEPEPAIVREYELLKASFGVQPALEAIIWR